MTTLNEAQSRIVKIIKASGKKGALVGQLSNEEKGTVHAPATESLAKKGLVVINTLESGVRRAILGDLSILKNGAAKADKSEKPAKAEKPTKAAKSEKPAKAEKPAKSKKVAAAADEDEDEGDEDEDEDEDEDDSDDETEAEATPAVKPSKATKAAKAEKPAEKPAKAEKSEKPAKASKASDKPKLVISDKAKGSLLNLLSQCRKAAREAGKSKEWYDTFVGETSGQDLEKTIQVVQSHFSVTFETEE